MDPVVMDHLKSNNEAAEKHVNLARHNQDMIKQTTYNSSLKIPLDDQSFLWLDKELLQSQSPLMKAQKSKLKLAK